MGRILTLLIISIAVVSEVSGAALVPVPVPDPRDCTPKFPAVTLPNDARWELSILEAAGWNLVTVNGTETLQKEFVFDSFNKAFTFITSAAIQATYACHIPIWINSGKKVNVFLSTGPGVGLSKNDIAMGHYMDNEEEWLAPKVAKKYNLAAVPVIRKLLGAEAARKFLISIGQAPN